MAYVPNSPVVIGELLPAVCEAERRESPRFSLATAVPACSADDLSPSLVRVANQLYDLHPFHVNSAYRSRQWDLLKGRSGNSSHCKGYAMDIRVVDHRERLRFLGELIRLGVTRIGIAKTFIHFDVDPDKPSSVWLYDPSDLSQTF